MLMGSGAYTPEELETLLEDALLIGDHDALAALFEPGSTLATGSDRPARGREESARHALMLWHEDHPYLAAPRQVLVTRELALVIGDQGINVLRRAPDGCWRYAIVWQAKNDDMERN